MNKTTIKIASIVAYVVTGFAGTSFAGSLKDDIIVIIPPSWEGRFIGISGGYSKGGELHHSGKTEVLAPAVNAHESAIAESIGGGTFGVHLGYNHIIVARGARGLMVGAILDIMSLSTTNKLSREVSAGILDSLGQPTNQAQHSNTSSTASASALGPARLRAGIATDHMLVYVSGGVAAAKVTAKTDSKTMGWDRSNINGTSQMIAQGYSDKNSFEFGYIVGAGVEIRLSDRLSIGLDYSYYQIPVSYSGSIDVSPGLSGSTAHYDVKGMLGDHLLRLNMNYLFNSSY